MVDTTIITVLRTPPLFRNRDFMKKNLDSIENQTEEVRGILVDYGSDDNQLVWIRELINEYKRIKLIEVKKPKDCIFGEAVNVGIRQSDTKYTAMMGADTLLKKTAIERAYGIMKGSKGYYLTGLARKVNERGRPGGEDKKSDKGSFIMASTQWLHKVHGFDEKLRGWGCDDGDLYDRAMREGLRHEWLVNEVMVREHQVVDLMGMNKAARYNSNLIDKEKTIIRNLNGWGNEKN
jgi:GT2 family glycosyltransferase